MGFENKVSNTVFFFFFKNNFKEVSSPNLKVEKSHDLKTQNENMY